MKENIFYNLKEENYEKETLIQSLQSEKKNLVSSIEKYKTEGSDEIGKLLVEIDAIRNNNAEKENAIDILEKEKKLARSKLDELEQLNSNLHERIDIIEHEKGEPTNLSDELGINNRFSLHVSFVCDPCEKDFKEVNHFEKHKKMKHEQILQLKLWKLKEIEFQNQVMVKQDKLASALSKLREKEIREDYECRCKAYCRIFHHKHNWSKSKSQEIAEKVNLLESKYSCINCDKTFDYVDHFKLHTETNHVGNLDREEDNGEVIVINPSRISRGRLL